MQSRLCFFAIAALASFNAASATVTFDKSLKERPARQVEVSRFSAVSDNTLIRASADLAVLPASSKNAQSPLVAEIPQGAKISSKFAEFQVGPGTLWLPDMSWSGDPGAQMKVSLGDVSAKSTLSSYSCSARKTVIKTEDGIPVDTGFSSVSFELPDGTSVTVSCRTGTMRVTFIEP